MPRALALRHVTVPDPARAEYVERLLARVAAARRKAYHLWAFAAEGGRERVVEFIEAPDAAALDAALETDRRIEIVTGALPLDAPVMGSAEELASGRPRWERFTGLADAS